jgi:hypothetical protein
MWMTEPLTCCRVPKLFNLRMDPFERADIVSDQYDDRPVKNDHLHFQAARSPTISSRGAHRFPPASRFIASSTW